MKVQAKLLEPLPQLIAAYACLKNVFQYGECSKISNTFLILFSNKMLIIRAGIHNILVRIANLEDPDQTASEAVSSGSALFV